MSIVTRGYGSGTIITRGYGGFGSLVNKLREVIRGNSFVQKLIQGTSWFY